MKRVGVLLLLILFLCGCSSLDGLNGSKVIDSNLTEVVSIDNDAKNVSEPVLQNDVVDIDAFYENEGVKKYLPILMFHYIEDVPANTNDQLRYKLSFSPEKLDSFLSFFEENDIKTLTFYDLKQILMGEASFPDKAVILTFDDGHIDHYEKAFPILQKYRMHGVFFIISSKPDNDVNYMNWGQIKEMSESGQEIGSHTINHFDLTTLSRGDVLNELAISKENIENNIDKEVISFCYPSGKYNDPTLEIVEENYLFARTTESGKNFLFEERYELPTVRIFPETSLASLKVWFDIN